MAGVVQQRGDQVQFLAILQRVLCIQAVHQAQISKHIQNLTSAEKPVQVWDGGETCRTGQQQ